MRLWPAACLVALLTFLMPLVSAQTGTDLVHYAPAREVALLWPRPLLVIQSELDEVIDFNRGRKLWESASQPKYHVFFPEGSHGKLGADESVARIVTAFFREARSVPVI